MHSLSAESAVLTLCKQEKHTFRRKKRRKKPVMVLGLVAALGVGLAGWGIYKGSTDAGRAAKRAGQGAEDTLRTLSKEMTQMRVFLTQTAWPEVNKTMIHFRRVLDRADVFLVTSTFAVKVLALLFALCAAYVTHKLISGRTYTPRWQRRRNSLTAAIENTILQTVYCLCLVLAVVLALQLVRDLFDVSWPRSIPFVILIPSLTTLAILYQHLMVTVKAILTLLRFIPYVIIEVPINMGLDPVAKGSCYMQTVPPLQFGICVIYLVLYSFVPYGAYSLMVYLTQSEESILKCMLIGYGVFYVATAVMYVIGVFIISQLIRPIWAFIARRNLERNRQ